MLYDCKSRQEAYQWARCWFAEQDVCGDLLAYVYRPQLMEMLPVNTTLATRITDIPKRHRKTLQGRVCEAMEGKWAIAQKQEIVTKAVRECAESIQRDMQSAGMRYSKRDCYNLIRYSLYNTEQE